MHSKTYYLFRHGETFATIRKRGYGLRILSASILPSAEPVIRKMGQFLKDVPTDFNVSSPIKRCQQTAEIISLESGKEFIYDTRIREFFVETFGMFKRRIAHFIEEVEESDYQSILVCTHAADLAGLIAFLTKDQFNAYDMQNYPEPGVLIKVENGQTKKYDFNS